MTTKVKICGITRLEDAELAVGLGADYLGFIFVKDSPRYVDPPECARIGGAVKVAAMPRHSKVVGVFRNASADEILRTVEVASLDFVQIHGDARVPFPTIRAFRVEDELPDTTTDADYVLFDTGGGTGRVFDWNLLAAYDRAKPFFLAGGITPDNVADAIAKTQPFAIDLASGVERAPGIKDHDKLKKLFEAIPR